MNVFLAGRDVTIELEFLDGYDLVTPSSASYTIYDQDDAEIKASTAISPTSSTHDLSIVAADNALGGETKAFRRIEVEYVTPSGTTQTRTFSYVLVNKLTLTSGTNSFASSGRMMIISTEVGNIDELTDSDFEQVQIALAQAWRNLGRLPVEITIAETVYTSTIDLDSAALTALPAADLRLLQEAQLIEADFLLGGNPVEQRRRMGLMSESIGEVSQFFRTRTPLTLPVCRDAAKRLSKFMVTTRKLSRA